MTTRERAYDALLGLPVDADYCGNPEEPRRSSLCEKDASRVMRSLDAAGLTIVDREMYQAFVVAMRAYIWQGYSLDLWPDPTNEVEQTAKMERERLEFNQTENALDRAAILLAEAEGIGK